MLALIIVVGSANGAAELGLGIKFESFQARIVLIFELQCLLSFASLIASPWQAVATEADNVPAFELGGVSSKVSPHFTEIFNESIAKTRDSVLVFSVLILNFSQVRSILSLPFRLSWLWLTHTG